MDIPSTQLSSFLVTAQCNSFSSAAEKLYISHSALIQQMNALEKTLGFHLFHRTPKGISLTESGEYFYQQYTQISQQMNQLINDCIHIEQKESVIRIGNHNDLDTFYLYSDLYRQFMQKYPSYSIEYIPTTREDVLSDCMNGHIDLGKFFGTESQKDNFPLSFTPIHLELGIFVPANHPLSGKQYLTIEDLAGKHIHLSNISFHDNIYEQLPVLQYSTLHTIDLSMSAIYEKNHQNELILLPTRFQKFFPPLQCIPLNPRGWFITEMVCRPNASPAVKKFLEFYLEYEEQQGHLSM